MLRNFGEVLKGKLFRSGKYQAQELQQAIQRYYLERVIYLSETLPFLRPKTYQKLRVRMESETNLGRNAMLWLWETGSP